MQIIICVLDLNVGQVPQAAAAVHQCQQRHFLVSEVPSGMYAVSSRTHFVQGHSSKSNAILTALLSRVVFVVPAVVVLASIVIPMRAMTIRLATVATVSTGLAWPNAQEAADVLHDNCCILNCYRGLGAHGPGWRPEIYAKRRCRKCST